MARVEEILIDLLSEQTGVEKAYITREKNLRTDLQLDSLDCVEVIMELEDALETVIPDEDAENLDTVGQAIDYLYHRIATFEAHSE